MAEVTEQHSDKLSYNMVMTAGAHSEKGKLADNISALLQQEESKSYASVDYLSMTAWTSDMYQLMGRRPPPDASCIDEYCREQICEWLYRVVDYFRIDREVVSVSLSYLDRFLGTCSCDRSMFKLAATTTLYMAVKVLHPSKLEDLGVLSDLSRGEFDMEDVAEMEQHILRLLSWRLHPPTAVALASLTLEYALADGIPSLSFDDTHEIKDTTSFFAELAVCDYFFTTLPPSTVALASILNAVEGVLTYETDMTRRVMEQIRALPFPMNLQQVTAARNRLWELYERSEECALHLEAFVEEEQAVVSFTKKSMQTLSSPVSVNLPYKHSDSFPSATQFKTLQNGSW
jgi:hypothetical protein